MVAVEPLFEQFIGLSVMALETAAAIIILGAASAALWRIVRTRGHPGTQLRNDFGKALLLALDFAIGSDVLKVAVAPTLAAAGVVAVVVLVRVVLTFVLERELRRAAAAGDSHSDMT